MIPRTTFGHARSRRIISKFVYTSLSLPTRQRLHRGPLESTNMKTKPSRDRCVVRTSNDERTLLPSILHSRGGEHVQPYKNENFTAKAVRKMRKDGSAYHDSSKRYPVGLRHPALCRLPLAEPGALSTSGVCPLFMRSSSTE